MIIHQICKSDSQKKKKRKKKLKGYSCFAREIQQMIIILCNFNYLNNNEIKTLKTNIPNLQLTLLLRNWLRPRRSVSSAAVMAFGKSCLLANTSKTASRSSSSRNCRIKLDDYLGSATEMQSHTMKNFH